MTTADRRFWALKLSSALGCGLMAGVFFAFSVFVMSALAQLPPSQGIAAMQAINVKVLNPLFMAVFMGTAATCLILVVSALWKWHQPGAVFLLIGGLLYLIGTFGVTVAFNVPMNDALASVRPHSSGAARLWAAYVAGWTAWNHVRTVAALTASASFILALYQRVPH